jgi:hypothetical protein
MLSFLAAQYGTVSDVEIVWTLIALIGAIFSIHNLIQSLGDKKYLDRMGIENGRLTLAKFSILMEGCRVAIQTIFMTIGIGSMFLADVSEHNLPTTYVVFGAIFRWGLIFAASLVTFKSYLGWQVRKELIAQRVQLDGNDVSKVDIKAENVTVSEDNGNDNVRTE